MSSHTDHTGAEPLPGLEPAAVQAWIVDAVPGLTPPLAFTRMGGGLSNLTFVAEDQAGRTIIVRRPPLGELLQSAHDMPREHKILAGLAPAGLPIPQPLAICTDTTITGAPFYVMEKIDGHVIEKPEQAARLSAAARANVGPSMVRALAGLHAVRPAEVGLGDLGKPSDYAARQVKRWARQWEHSKTEESAAIDRLTEQLRAATPDQTDVSIVHGDYNLANVIIDDRGEVAGIVDWELCTLGEPLADLGIMLTYWAEPGDDLTFWPGAPTAGPDFASRAALIDGYREASGRDLTLLPYYLALAQWRLAVIIQGVYHRSLANPVNARGIGPTLVARRDSLIAMAERSAVAAGL